MIADELRQAFITTERPYREGDVELFEQVIDLPAGVAVSRAELAITALGMYEAELDGKKVGDACLTPGFTYYPHDLGYQVYDVTEALVAGAKALRVHLAQGWYCGRFTCENKKQIWGERPAVAWVLEVSFADGTSMRSTSADADVRALPSPFDFAGLYDGEVYWANDSREERSDEYEVFPPVPYAGALPDEIRPAAIRTTLHEAFEPVSVDERPDGTVIVDFGQNMAGIIELDTALIAGNAGCVTIRHGEILNPDGSLYTANLRTAKATITYHAGEPEGIWRPRFTYMGFRYVELSGTPWQPGLLRARALYTDMERTGWFTCGDDRVNRVYLNQLWGQRSNYVEVPTDCPQRDERQGYTGDGHAFARTAAYNYDTQDFLEKFLRDIRMSQLDHPDHYVAASVPTVPPETAAPAPAEQKKPTISPEAIKAYMAKMGAQGGVADAGAGGAGAAGAAALAAGVGAAAGAMAGGAAAAFAAGAGAGAMAGGDMSAMAAQMQSALAERKPGGIGFVGMQEWASADTILPELLYEQFGDISAFETQYESMRAMVDCKLERAGERGLWFGVNLGDWLAPGADMAWAAQHNGPVSGAFMVNDLRIMVRAAELLGRADDAARYGAALERARAAYRAAFIGEDGRLTDFYQGAAVMALALVLDREQDAEVWRVIFNQLVDDVRARGLQTGFFSTEHLLDVLVEGGEEKLAFGVLLSEDCPGWLYEVARGATTIWEKWDAIRPDGTVNEDVAEGQGGENMVSFNHYAFGSVGGFLYCYVLGIRPLEPGFARVLVEPHVDARLGHAEGTYRSRAGEIRVAWAFGEGGAVSFDITVPAPALIRLPDGAEHDVAPGTYRYEVRI